MLTLWPVTDKLPPIDKLPTTVVVPLAVPMVVSPVIVVTEFCVAVLSVPVKVAPVLPIVAARTVAESMVPIYPLIVLILAPVKVEFRLPKALAYTLLNVPE